MQATRESKLPYFGVVAGTNVPRYERLYEVNRIAEKPTPTFAEQETAHTRSARWQYLGYFGMHVFTPGVMEAVGKILDTNANLKPTLSDAAAC